MGNFNRGGRSDFKYNSGRDSDRGGSGRGGYGGRDPGRGGFGGNRGGGGFRDRNEDREMFQATCTECGKSCEVPFKPSGGKPVLCRDCFRGARGDDCGGRDSSRRDFPPRSNRDDYRQQRDNTIGGKSAEHFDQQFSLLNEKLDKILQRLTPSYMREQTESPHDAAQNDTLAQLIEPKPVTKKKGSKKKPKTD